MISIHLMLLFIMSGLLAIVNSSEFQYISCYCLSITIGDGATQYVYFNTSHVTVYQREQRKKLRSITNFNTSHVTVYPSVRQLLHLQVFNFNTSHVTVYPFLYFIKSYKIVIFQYISCYCLSKRTTRKCCDSFGISIHLMLLFI